MGGPAGTHPSFGGSFTDIDVRPVDYPVDKRAPPGSFWAKSNRNLAISRQSRLSIAVPVTEPGAGTNPVSAAKFVVGWLSSGASRVVKNPAAVPFATEKGNGIDTFLSGLEKLTWEASTVSWTAQ
jgi:hypothetical protein